MKPLFAHFHFKTFFFTFVLFIILFTVFTVMFGDDGNRSEKEQTTNTTTSTGDTYVYEHIRGFSESSNKLLLVPVKGIILTERTGDLGFFELLEDLSITYGYEIQRKLIRAAENEDIKGIYLEMNSPGGTIGGAHAISEGIEYYKQETGNPIYTHIVDQGTSGGYWAAASTDNITAEVGSITGSIGVIMGPFKYYDTVVAEGDFAGSVQTEGGIESRFFSAGQYKDTGSPYRPLEEEEVEHWQNSVDNEYDLFVEHIHTTRDISRSTIRETIKALPYGNTEALRLGLIDDVGGEDRVLAKLLAAANVSEDDYELVGEIKEFGFFEELFSALKRSQTPQVSSTCVICNRPLYLYDASFEIFDKVVR